MIPQVLSLDETDKISKIMQNIGVDKEGIKIMTPKTKTYVIKTKSLSNISANILKQEILSLGGDAAISRDVLTGEKKSTDCLLFGTILQLNRLTDKLKTQPLGLDKLATQIECILNDYQKRDFLIKLPKFKLDLGKRTLIIGIVNLTPDSFSGDGRYKFNIQHSKFKVIDEVVRFVEKIISDGADMIDIGGESSRPGARAISAKEEIKRVIPVLKKLVRRVNVPISIDTYKPEVAKRALDLGVSIVNDITALRRNEEMAKIISSYKVGVILMHMKGDPRTMQRSPNYKDLISEIIDYLDRQIKFALDFGIEKERIIVDPGIGFGKTTEDNLEILRRLREFKVLGRPILIGVSRKSFIGNVLNKPVAERLFGTMAAVAMSIANGANIVRVHDVKEISEIIKICNTICEVR